MILFLTQIDVLQLLIIILRSFMIVNRNYLNLIIYYSKTSKSYLKRITMVEKGIDQEPSS